MTGADRIPDTTRYSRPAALLRTAAACLWIFIAGSPSVGSAMTAGSVVAARDRQRADAAKDTHRIQAERLFAEAEALRSEGRLVATTASLVRYRQAFNLWTTAEDRKGQARAKRRLGEALHALGRSDDALAALLDSLSVSRLAADAEAESAALSAAASVYLDLGRMTDANKFSRQALALSRKSGDRRGEAAALNVCGDVDMFSGRSRESLASYQDALAISRTLSDRRGQAQALLNLGYTYADLAQVSDSLASYEAALKLWQDAGDRSGQARTLTGLGQLHAVAGENQLALNRYRQATEVFELLGDRVGLAITLNGLAMVHFRLGDPTTSVAYLQRAVELFRTVKLRNGEAGNLLDLGRCLTVLGRHREALDSYLGALAIARSIADRRLEARALGQVGQSFAALGQLEKALGYYRESRALAKAVSDPLCEVNALDGLADLLHAQGRSAEALSHLEAAVALAERSQHRFAESQARYDLARIQAAIGHLESALANVQASLHLVETLRGEVASLDLRASYVASIRDIRELEIDLLMQLNDRNPGGKNDARAFDASEQARARSFLDGLAEARAEVAEGAPPELLERERALRRSLNAKAQLLAQVRNDVNGAQAASLFREIDAITNGLREVTAQIRADSPRYAALTEPKPLTIVEVQKSILDDQSVLLQYFLGKTRSYIWAVTQNEIEGFVLPARDEIDRRVRSYREALTAPAREPLSAREPSSARFADARALSRMLLGPAAAYLNHPRVLIVADGVLHLLPFAALPDPRTMMSDTQGDVPLIAEHELVYLPSASTLALVRGTWNQERRWPKAARVFADPVFEADDPRIGETPDRTDASHAAARLASAEPVDSLKRALRDLGGLGTAGVPRLLESRREARDIAALAPGVDVAFDFEANRASAMSPTLADYRVIHFATHGIIDNDHPELSGVVLSLFNEKGERQDGFLRLHDIYNLKLPVDLVVLSACSTALGKEIVGEGLIGLVRGFMYAGSRRVLASLWKVDDEATSELMTRFYRALFERRLTPPAALQAAQVDLLKTKRWAHPFYWAGFVLQGEWK